MARLEIFILLTLTAIVASYQPPDWGNPLYVFRQYDIDRNGQLDWFELSDMFPLPGQLRKAVRTYDEDMNGTLDPQEFAKVLRRNANSDEFDGY